MSSTSRPLPLFDSLALIGEPVDYHYLQNNYCLNDIEQARMFLKGYQGSQGTFNSYRREVERLIHYASLIQGKTLAELDRQDIEHYVKFCQNPPLDWIGNSKPSRFVLKDGQRQPNPDWRPFIATVSKTARKKGAEPSSKQFVLSSGSLRELFAILSSFFNYLLQERFVTSNPIVLIRQKSQFIRKAQSQAKIRRLSELQWQYVIETATLMAEQDPDNHERTLFIMSALYSMYLRISELAASERWIPQMNHFFIDHDGNWWFTTVGKGNKERQIAVSDSMLAALKRWRRFLALSELPTTACPSPLLPKIRGKGAMKSVNHIRRIVQHCFDSAVQRLETDGFSDEAEQLNQATVHWLRHTGISDDVKIRPREHVRDDAGHSSSAITDKYIDIGLRERHLSAKKKQISETPYKEK